MNEFSALEEGPLCRFADWPNPDVPSVAAGVYAVWQGDELVYVGMSGRGMSADELATAAEAGQRRGLWTLLNSHAQGRRSGDQFCVYVGDRLVLPTLDREHIAAIGRGEMSLDAFVKDYIHEHLAYRFLVVESGRAAQELEAQLRAGALEAGRPRLNPA